LMRWLVVGAGGIGGYFGGLLAYDRQDVTFLARGEHLEAMLAEGLRIESMDGVVHVKDARGTASVDGEEPFDVVLFCVKTYDNVTAAKAIRAAVDHRTIVISIQNGLDNDKSLHELLPDAEVYPGLAHIVSARTAPGVVRRTGGAGTLVFGDPHQPASARLREIAQRLRKAHIDATVSPDIESAQWNKFVFIVAFAGLTSICRAPIGDVLRDPVAMDLYRRCVAETVAVARASGVRIDPTCEAAAMKRTEAYRGAQERATSSMLRDLLDGRPTEVEALHGAVVHRAEKYGVNAVVNSAIYAAVRLASTRPGT
jgi:2-dehydropantoate 2-reductase